MFALEITFRSFFNAFKAFFRYTYTFLLCSRRNLRNIDWRTSSVVPEHLQRTQDGIHPDKVGCRLWLWEALSDACTSVHTLLQTARLCLKNIPCSGDILDIYNVRPFISLFIRIKYLTVYMTHVGSHFLFRNVKHGKAESTAIAGSKVKNCF